MADMSHHQSDQARRLENLLTDGVIAAVDHAAGKIRVELAGGRLTDWIRIPGEIGANFRRWRPMRIGTPVTLAAVSGDPANARILQTFYCDSLPAPGDRGDLDLILYDDGTRLAYDSAAHALTVEAVGAVTVRAKGAVTVNSDDSATVAAPRISLTGAVRIEGDVEIAGNLHASGNILNDGSNANHHRH